MSVSINLECILDANPDYAAGQYIDLPIVVHVQKRLERFIYNRHIRDDSIPICYIENLNPNVINNLAIVNKSYLVPINSSRLFDQFNKFDIVVSKSYSSQYSNILATDYAIADSNGNIKPLFFRHELPENTTSAALYSYSHGNKVLVDEGYIIDLTTRSIYTNYHNAFNYNSGSYTLFFVSGSTSDGQVFNTLLNIIPVAREAEWSDIDLETGMLKQDVRLYTKEKSGRGYTYYFNKGTKWYIKPQSTSLVGPLPPSKTKPNTPWFIRFTNGDVSGVVNNEVRRYRISEFDTQNFYPFNPIKYATYEDVLYVNNKCLSAIRDNLYIKPEDGLHLEIKVENEQGDLIEIYTTDSSLEGAVYSNTGIVYSTDRISSWDNSSGIIALSAEIFPNRIYKAKYYYKVFDFEYTYVNLNPVINRKMRDHTYVFYCIPNTSDGNRSIHHLTVNREGIIVECSQTESIDYINLQLRNNDGSYNSNTIIGTKYFSEYDDNFLSTYAASFSNTNAYLILAEITGIDRTLTEDQFIVDVRRKGDSLDPENISEAFRANPKLLHSKYGYGPNGQVVPEDNVMILDVPISLLEAYGGSLTEDQVKQHLRTHMPVYGYASINWIYPVSEISGNNYTVGQIVINYTWEGTCIYKVYKRASSADSWTLISTNTNPARGLLSYTDSDVTSGLTYQYAVAITKNDVEYPYSDVLTIKVK